MSVINSRSTPVNNTQTTAAKVSGSAQQGEFAESQILLDIIYRNEINNRKLHQTILTQAEQLQQLQLEQQSLLHSGSWKITYPLRLIKKPLTPVILLLKIISQRPTIVFSWLRKYSALLLHRAGFSNRESDHYHNWYQKYYVFNNALRKQMRDEIHQWQKPPLITIIMPVYNVEKDHLTAAIESIRSQIYEHWQLCITDDASTEKHIKPLLLKYQQQDKRIDIVFHTNNQHISIASNAAINIAQGDYIAFLDHDDLLTEDALFQIAKRLIELPETQFIYSDEDRLESDPNIGERLTTPYFKPDWNIELFLSHNYLTHFAVYSKAVVNSVGGLREGYEGAQDYDLALRVTEQLNGEQIQHIARILYHWRITPQSTASGLQAKPYAFNAGLKALNDYLQRQNIKAQALDAPDAHGNYRIKYQLPDALPLVSLIIPTYNQYVILRQCIDSILQKTDYANYELIIVDNKSDDPVTLEYLSHIALDDKISVLRYEHEFNFSAINNWAVKQAAGSIIGLLNNDLEVINSDWLGEMVSHALNPGVGAVGAKLLYPDNSLQHAGIILGIAGAAGHSHKRLPQGEPGQNNRTLLLQNFTAVTAACMIMKKSVFEEVGGFDEVHLKIAFNDVDLGCKISHAGYRIVWTPYAKLYHHESISRGYEDTPEKYARMMSEIAVLKKRWGSFLLNDANYNPNLTLDSEDFSLACPPRIEYIA